MISDEEKIKKTNISNNFTESDYKIDKEEDLDFNLLFDTLDSIFDEEIIEEENLNINAIKPKNVIPNLAKFVKQMYDNTSWHSLNQTNEVRSELCRTCLSLTCTHVNFKGSRLDIESVIDDALEKCTHQMSEDWLLDDMCAKCIILSCEKVTLAEITELYVIWDETDLIQYHDWINNIDKESSLYN
ncbi:MAG: hypothetical protein GPJ54_13725 [Candidatus Heimdallarchaeota archaeon]|nr:hypothetical protein [Candidatus Heimdallarchaeota archaeon]